jgi:hypothetical protein
MTFDVKYEDGALRMYDKIERKLVRFFIDGWEFTDKTYEFRYPVDEVFSGRCKKMSFGPFLTHIRRHEDYEIIEEITPYKDFKLKKNKYIGEVNAHIKIYFFVDSEINARSQADNVAIEFDKEREVVFGIRSYHKRPQATIKTTKDIGDLARTISFLSSSIKIDNCERSYPTLRGHPPLIEFGDELFIPEELKRFESGVDIFVPRKLEYLYIASPLAYYLLADIKFGDPKIACDNGFTYKLPKLPAFEDEVSTLLQKIFFLDCLVRNAGLHKLNLHELDALKDLDIDIKELYPLDIKDQLPTYLDVPFEKIKPYMPTWHLSSYVEPLPEKVVSLPFLLNQMALIYLPESSKISTREIIKSSLHDFFRSGDVLGEKDISDPHLKEAQSHIWLSPEIPIGIAKAEEISFLNQLKYYGREKDSIEIALVLNDAKMRDEKKKVSKVYEQRKEVPLKTEIFDFTTIDELADIFAKGFDLVHFIGHCDKDGLVCQDGGLKVENMEENNTPVFFLNACNSYGEGMNLIKKGSVGGVVTLYEVLNKEALDVGYTFSRLLGNGFPIGKAIELAKMKTIYGKDYLVLGNSEYSVMYRDYLIPYYFSLDKKRDKFFLRIKTHGKAIGGFFYPNVEQNKDIHLLFNDRVFELTYEGLIKAMKSHSLAPVIYRTKLYWTDDLVEVEEVLSASRTTS